MVYRIYVEKKKELAHEAGSLLKDINGLLQIKSVKNVRVINRYDVDNIEKELFDYAVGTVFSEPQLDIATEEIETMLSDEEFIAEDTPTTKETKRQKNTKKKNSKNNKH